MNKTVLITGSTSGIGKATSVEFAKFNWNVIITYHSDKKSAQEVSKVCKETGSGETKYYHLELDDNSSIKDFHKKVIADFKEIDILVNNAGYCYDGLLTESTFGEIDKQINTNLTGLIKLTKLFLPEIKNKIINIASQYSKEAHEEYTTYCASKWGVRGFTKALAKELKDVDCITVNPGPTKTKMNDFWEGGVEPEEVAKIIIDVALNKREVASGGDVDVWELVS